MYDQLYSTLEQQWVWDQIFRSHDSEMLLVISDSIIITAPFVKLPTEYKRLLQMIWTRTDMWFNKKINKTL